MHSCLVSHGCPTRSAVLLFCDEPNKRSGAAQIRICKMSNSAEIEFYDDLDAPLYLQVDMAMDLIRTKYTKSPMSYNGLANIETSPYPMDAVREAILNAAINSDYGIGTAIKLMVYDDHMEILNFGGLPYGSDLDTIIKNHISKSRNESISNVFRRAHYVEKFGRGFEKMIKSYDGTGVEPPTFDTDELMLCVKFKDIVYAKGIVARGFDGEPLSEGCEVIPASIRTVAASFEMSVTQKKIVELLRNNPKESAYTMADVLGIT